LICILSYHIRTMQSYLLQVVNWTVHCGRVGSAANVELMNAVLKHFVDLWSQQEEARKEREASEQSLYRYRTQTCGDGLNEDERDEKDITARFPSFEQVSHNVFNDLGYYYCHCPYPYRIISQSLFCVLMFMLITLLLVSSTFATCSNKLYLIIET